METFIYVWQMDESVCDPLIQYHAENTEYKYEGTSSDDGRIIKEVKESIDVSYFNNSSHPAILNYYQELQKGYNAYVERFNIKHLRLNTEMANNIQYYPPGGGFKIWHWERDNGSYDRQLVYMTYLNTVTDGGGTEWYYQGVKLDAVKGLSVIWPADFTHTHRGIVSPTQEKWIATGWFNYIK
jgi:hypothetical protein